MNSGVFVCMQAAEASASSTNDWSASEEVVGAATVKDSEAGSADLSGGGREQPDDVVAAMVDKAVEAAAEGEALPFFFPFSSR